jgi:uncharacterized protein (DUF1697 family)
MSRMATHAALLRGINVGGHQRVAMADLRALLAGLGHTEVSTLLQSGNAVFSSRRKDEARLAGEIEEAIARKLKLTVRCLVRDRRDLQRVVDRNPLPARVGDPARLLVTFLSDKPDRAFLKAIDPRAYAPEEFGAGERELYVWSPGGLRDSKLTHAFFEKKLAGVVATSRNWNTVTRLLALMG